MAYHPPFIIIYDKNLPNMNELIEIFNKILK
jgi:hypothetical protein